MSALEKFAEELKEQRESLEISVSELYEITRIDKNYLVEMEKGNFKIMPDVYMRAFIRKYADAVELDANETIKKYEAAQNGKTVSKEVETYTEDKSEAKITLIDDEPKLKETVISETNYNPYIIIIFIIAVALIGYFYYAFIYSANNKIIVEQRVENIISGRNSKANTSRFELKRNNSNIEANDDSKSNSGLVKTDSLTLKINALDTVWFRTQIDKAKTDEFILNPNRSKVLNAKSQIDILVGNTGGIEFVLNGKKLKFDGKKGEIRKVIINSDGIHYSNVNVSTKK